MMHGPINIRYPEMFVLCFTFLFACTVMTVIAV